MVLQYERASAGEKLKGKKEGNKGSRTREKSVIEPSTETKVDEASTLWNPRRDSKSFSLGSSHLGQSSEHV